MSDKVQIRPSGELLPLDESGCIVNICSRAKIVEPWLAVVEEAKRAYLGHFGDKVDSIYVRGSVARGGAVEGISDVDMFAVIEGDEAGFDDSWMGEFGQHIKAKFPFCQKVDMELIPYSELMDFESEEFMADRLMIKTMSVCIYGEDLAPKWAGFKPDQRIAFNAMGINELMSMLRQKLAATVSSNEIKDLCTGIMKRFLRIGFELIMAEEGAYTRDLYLCYKLFSKYYPDRETDMYRALELALNPVADKAVILGMVDGFGGWMSREVRRKFRV